MADPMTAAEVQPEAATLEVSEFSSLLQREFKPKSCLLYTSRCV